jgi:hypothetical protein
VKRENKKEERPNPHEPIDRPNKQNVVPGERTDRRHATGALGRPRQASSGRCTGRSAEDELGAASSASAAQGTSSLVAAFGERGGVGTSSFVVIFFHSIGSICLTSTNNNYLV